MCESYKDIPLLLIDKFLLKFLDLSIRSDDHHNIIFM